MPNNAYLRSTRREREIVNEARAKGYDSGRTAGSHSPHDVYIFDRDVENKNDEPTVFLIQVKTEKGGKKLVIKNQVKYYNALVVVEEHHYINEANRERKRESKRKGRSKAKGVKPRISGDVCGGN